MSPELKVTIGSAADKITIGPRKGDYIDFVLERQSLRASTTVYLYDDNLSLLKFFEELSKNWQGWEGTKNWKSLEGDLSIQCSTDKLGHVAFNLEISNNNIEPSWTLRTTVMAEAGNLNDLLTQVRTVLA